MFGLIMDMFMCPGEGPAYSGYVEAYSGYVPAYSEYVSTQRLILDMLGLLLHMFDVATYSEYVSWGDLFGICFLGRLIRNMSPCADLFGICLLGCVIRAKQDMFGGSTGYVWGLHRIFVVWG